MPSTRPESRIDCPESPGLQVSIFISLVKVLAVFSALISWCYNIELVDSIEKKLVLSARPQPLSFTTNKSRQDPGWDQRQRYYS